MVPGFIRLPRPLLRCAQGVEWRAAPDGIVVSSPGLTVRLPYPEAALWDFVVRGIPEVRIAEMMRHIGGFADTAAAAAFVDQSLCEWRGCNLIVCAGPEPPSGPPA